MGKEKSTKAIRSSQGSGVQVHTYVPPAAMHLHERGRGSMTHSNSSSDIVISYLMQSQNRHFAQSQLGSFSFWGGLSATTAEAHHREHNKTTKRKEFANFFCPCWGQYQEGSSTSGDVIDFGKLHTDPALAESGVPTCHQVNLVFR